MLKNPHCPHDGSPMRRDVRPFTMSYKGQSATVDAPGWYCDECGEGIFSGADMAGHDDIMHYLKAQAEGLLEPKDIRRIRKKLGLSQKDAGLFIGGGPRAFQKYESGALLPSRGINSALLLLDRDPAAFAELKNHYPPRANDAGAGDRPHA